ncbi:hypothetical protein N7491_006432 [Penicillium cf. griseofulvum]|uniref:Uncharacterized protein n=1 Tax=Penicillium cf. griseofulvum TaxID=2972120 RepID=A0A9W9IXF3_9EURO|nr:hypothetical protein N7472_010537 [Penicillium cf. griseofulvum]KAJ5429416.1 hypothetical protein N7491_006432 [Penicillium cf. griseofulvum]
MRTPVSETPSHSIHGLINVFNTLGDSWLVQTNPESEAPEDKDADIFTNSFSLLSLNRQSISDFVFHGQYSNAVDAKAHQMENAWTKMQTKDQGNPLKGPNANQVPPGPPTVCAATESFLTSMTMFRIM